MDLERKYWRTLLEAWNLCNSQFLMGFDGPYALNMAVLPFVFKTLRVKKKWHKWLTEDLRTISNGFIKGLRETLSSKVPKV